MAIQQFDLLKKSAVTQIQSDLESAVEADRLLAQQAAEDSADAKDLSQTAQGLSEAARDKSEKWAENPEDVEVEAGKYSALHWAAKAQTSAETIIESADMLIRHEAEIDSLENVINSANLNQETTATATGIDVVALPKTAANTGMKVQLFGQSAQNLIVNGDFRNGAAGWSALQGTASASGGVLTGTVTTTRVSFAHTLQSAPNTVDIFYFKFTHKTPVNSLSRKIAVYFSSTHNLTGTLNSTPDWSNYSRVGNFSNTTNRLDFVFGADGNPASGETFSVKDVIFINLTATFGAGNEPNKEQCDLLFANYFEGYDNVLGTGRVRSVGKNLLSMSEPLYHRNGYAKMNYIIDGNKLLYISGGLIGSSMVGIFTKVKPNTQYTFKVNSYSGIVAGDMRVYEFKDKPYNYLFDTSNSLAGHSDLFQKTITTTGSTNWLFIGIKAVSASAYIGDIQLEIGSTATTYEPYRQSILQLTTPEIRSNRLVKDEIRKGASGYELVKRVGVGNITGAVEKITNNTFETDLAGWSAFAGTISRETGTRTGGSGSYIMRVVSDGTQGSSRRISILATGKWYKITGWSKSDGTSTPRISVGGSDSAGWVGTTSTSWQYFSFFIQSNGSSLYLRSTVGGVGTYTDWDDVYCYELPIPEDISSTSAITEFSNNIIHYTLAAPTITPIAHAGLLNSNSNGTAYFEPIIADAGVYSSNLAIQLTDYPIASFESIRKYDNGTYTELNPATAVIASGGLSFTHPDLASGDLVMFTYAYNRESIGRSMTLTHYDSRFVIADTANSKVYRWRITSTNGVASIALTEI